jgi:hypothetical protein
MMRRVGASVGLPLLLGVGFFPLFYYLKAVRKVDVPTWIPFGVSFVFFGAALLGVSYGIVSASWDPNREGSRPARMERGEPQLARLLGLAPGTLPASPGIRDRLLSTRVCFPA